MDDDLVGTRAAVSLLFCDRERSRRERPLAQIAAIQEEYIAFCGRMPSRDAG